MTEIRDIINIAEKVNRMSYGRARTQIKELEKRFDAGNLSFHELVELQCLITRCLVVKEEIQNNQ